MTPHPNPVVDALFLDIPFWLWSPVPVIRYRLNSTTLFRVVCMWRVNVRAPPAEKPGATPYFDADLTLLPAAGWNSLQLIVNVLVALRYRAGCSNCIESLH